MKITHCYPKNTFHLRFHFSSEDKAERGWEWARPDLQQENSTEGLFPGGMDSRTGQAGPTSDNTLGPDPHLIKSAL